MRGFRALFVVMAGLAGLSAIPAQAQDDSMTWDEPVIHSIQQPLDEICRRRGLQSYYVPDFVSGTDAERDGRADDTLVDAAGFSCRSGPEDQDNMDDRPLCDAGGCKQWLIVNGPGGGRVAWTGERRRLFSMGDGLVDMANPCRADGCSDLRWNGRALVPASRRRGAR